MKLDELQSMTVAQLKLIADYYEIPLKPNMKKAEIIDLLYKEQPEDEKPKSDLPPMSVRVRRIYEANLKKE